VWMTVASGTTIALSRDSTVTVTLPDGTKLTG
jgi:hypothetical protein